MNTTFKKFLGAGSAAVLSLTVLGGMAPSAPETGPVAAAERMVPLVVKNDNFLDMHIYAVRGGVYYSVGFVTSFTTERFELRDAWVGPGDDFRLLADPIGGIGSYLTEPIIVGPNQMIMFNVKESLNLSNYTLQPIS